MTKIYTGHIAGNLILNGGVDTTKVTSVGGCVDARPGAQLDLSACTSVGLSVYASENAQLDLSACTSVGGGVDARPGAQLDLSACTSVGGGVDASENAQLDLSACTSVGGEDRDNSVLLAAKAQGRGFIHIPENYSTYYVHADGEYLTHRGESITLKYVDGSSMLILSERTAGEYTIFHAAYFGGGDLDKLKRCYVAQLGEHFAHGSTVEKAMRDVRFKAMEREFDQDELVAEIKARGTVMIEDFRLVTGACEEGTRHGMAQAGLNPEADELPLDVVLGAAFGSYGERFKALFVEESA